MATMTLPEKVVDYIGFADAAMEKAAAFQQAVATKQAAAEKQIEATLDALVSHERITPSQREKAAAILKDHAQTLELLTKLAGHRNPTELSALGTGVDAGGQKTASANGGNPANSLTNPHVGACTAMVKQSDHNFLAGLGLSPN